MFRSSHKKLKKQLGRSMMEMLGVLAIAGVLTIGALAGLTYAINVHRANDILHTVSLLGSNALTSDKTYDNVECSLFTEPDVEVPSAFQTCTLSISTDDLVTFDITYKADVSQPVLDLLKKRCSHELYVSTDAKTIILGKHSRNCDSHNADNNDNNNETPADDEQNNTDPNSDDAQDPKKWECITNADCYTTEEECINHKCFRCDVDSGNLSEECCKYATSRVSSAWRWEDGRCKYNGACPVHTIQACECEGPIMLLLKETGYSSRYCCDINESFASCCQAVGGTWCEASQVCIESNSSLSCENRCAAHSPIENCSCEKIKQITVVDVHTNEETPYCCDQRESVYFVGGEKRCCESVGGWWDNTNGSHHDDGTCYSEKKEQIATCLKVIESAYYGYSPTGSYMREECCEEASSEEECCTQKGYYWCAEHQTCARDACIYSVSCMGGDRACNYICDPHVWVPSFNFCICSTFLISVVIPNATEEKNYCCGKNDGSFKECCEALGFIWDGTGNNTGTCRTEAPNICIPYLQTAPESTTVCCFGSEQTNESCCEENNGFYCQTDEKCYAKGSGQSQQIYSMPCMTQEICENYKYKSYWCDTLHDGTHDKCFATLNDYLTLCADVSQTECESYSNKYWCGGSESKCYTNKADFYKYCSLVDETYCRENLGDTRHWCSADNTCYDTEYNYVTKCPKVTSADCTGYVSGYWYCTQDQTCFTGKSSGVLNCSKVTRNDCTKASSSYKYCGANSRCYRNQAAYDENCPYISGYTETTCTNASADYRYCASDKKCYTSQERYDQYCH